MSKGKVDLRATQRVSKKAGISQSNTNQLFRLRFYGIDQDRLDTIIQALFVAGVDMGTEYDAVALSEICTYFLATYTPDLSAKVSPTNVG